MDEPSLRCNNRTATGGICRQELKESAIVTTCSHVLCQQCTESTGFASNDNKGRRCPVCEQPLPNVDDAAQTNLRPTEQYKMSVLCGLDPTTIMECASSALSFWNYQMLQETAYQQHLLLALSKKYSGLNKDVNKVVTDANHEIDGLHTKLKAVSETNANLQHKNMELVDTCRGREKKYAELRKLYEALKRVTQHNQQNLTNEAVAEQTVQSFTADPHSGILGGFSNTKHNAVDRIGTQSHTLHSTQTPIDQRGVDQLHRYQRAGSGSQYSGEAYRMLPPHRLAHSIDISPVNVNGQNRTPLGSFRTTADRSTRIASANRDSQQGGAVPLGSGPRHSTRVPGAQHVNHNRQTSTASFGGISSGMKVGGPSIDDEIRRQSGYIPLRNLSHHHSAPSVSRHF